MTRDEQDKALLVAFAEFVRDHYHGQMTALRAVYEGRIDAFLATRQPPVEPPCHVCHNDPAKYELCSVGHAPPPGYAPREPGCPHGAMGPNLCAHCTPNVAAPPASQRFWRVYYSGRYDLPWHYAAVQSNGFPALPIQEGIACFTREQAEADGAASGLPEWKP